MRYKMNRPSKRRMALLSGNNIITDYRFLPILLLMRKLNAIAQWFRIGGIGYD